MTAISRYSAAAEVGFRGPASRVSALRQAAPLRVLLPRPEPGDRPLAVLANIAGGVVGGDRLGVSVSVTDEADVTVTGQAAEKIYRSDGATAELTLDLGVGDGAVLEYLPQGTILFDRSRMARRTRLNVAGTGRLLHGEILHLGRTAMGETFSAGALLDRLDLRQEGRLVWADALRLDGDPRQATGASSGLAGSAATALLVYAGPEAARFLDGVRALLPGQSELDLRGAAAVFEDGPLLVRWLGRDGAALRRSFGEVWRHLRAAALGRPPQLPRIWAI